MKSKLDKHIWKTPLQPDIMNQLQSSIDNAKHFSLFSQDSDLQDVLKYIEKQMLDEDVCVISIIGRSVMNCMNSKASLVGSLIGQNLFLPQVGEKSTLYKNNFAQIDGYYDPSNRIVFLHLTSTLDSLALLNREKQFVEKNLLSQWPDLSMDLLKAMILIFHISHIVIVSGQTPRFDISCINMFRIIDSLRVKLQPFVSEMLQSAGLSGLAPFWIKSGRFCVPQLLFTFEAYEGFEYINNDNCHHYVKQLEDQIARVLRKSRLISNPTNSSLFTVPSSFVFISTQNPAINDYNAFFFEKIYDRCRDEHTGNSKSSDNNFIGKYYSNGNRCNQLFLSFLSPHVSATLKGCDHPNPSQAPKPVKVSILIKVLVSLKELIFSQTYASISMEKSKNLQKIFDSLFSTLDIDNRFSEGRCSKMVHNAVNYYQENLPSHYTRETHERKLMLTMQYFTMHSRGPAIYKYIQMIQTECEKFWNNGRKMCEELSLTGNHCVNKLHRVPHDDYSSEGGIFEANSDGAKTTNASAQPMMPHASMAKIVSACNCGRRQGNREDPFTTKAGNYDFYLKMKYKCHTCRHITQIKFPVYDNFDLDSQNLSSSQNMTFRDSPKSVFSQEETKAECEEDEPVMNDEHADDDVFCSGDGGGLSNNNGLLADSPSDHDDQTGQEENYIAISCDSMDPAEKPEQFLTQSSENDEKNFSIEEDTFASDPDHDLSLHDSVRSPEQTSKVPIDVTTLPPMIHTLCTPNTPARFSSWSLVCLGSSSIYSHNFGIQDQQGFINGSHFLLPWNVTVVLQHAKNMPPLWEGKRPPGIKHKKTLKDGTQFTVKIFIGVEYECLRGHRFISCGPDQILKTNSNSFPENANKIADNDMPIYMHCICSRPGKSPTVAQLMRIHIVTPKAPIHVTLNPYVQMTPNASPLFYPGNSEPINLSQSSYWVLRLPMFYEADNGPFAWPKEPLPYCRLLKKCYGIADQVTKVKV